MSANRKLQTEIDRTLKKVEEGVEVFDEIWDKVYSATQQNQKEKYEVDLKKEIKKLQRHRDQIKTWVASSDIKDKRALTEARKLIETKMEQFKVCEKETKTKTYSKEGLAREAKLDPQEIAKNSTREWLSEKVDALMLQIDMHEADMEKLTSGKGSKRNKHEVEVLESSIKRHRWHIAKLEQITRLLDNDALGHEQINEIKEDVEYYIDANQEPDFMDAYDETMDIFESLDLGELPNEDDVALLGSIGTGKDASDEKGSKKGKKKSSKNDDDDDDDSKDSDKKKKKADKDSKKADKDKTKKDKKAAAASVPLTIGRATKGTAPPVPPPPTTGNSSPKAVPPSTVPKPSGVPAGVPQPVLAPPAPPPGTESLANILLKQPPLATKENNQTPMAARLRELNAAAVQQQAPPRGPLSVGSPSVTPSSQLPPSQLQQQQQQQQQQGGGPLPGPGPTVVPQPGGPVGPRLPQPSPQQQPLSVQPQQAMLGTSTTPTSSAASAGYPPFTQPTHLGSPRLGMPPQQSPRGLLPSSQQQFVGAPPMPAMNTPKLSSTLTPMAASKSPGRPPSQQAASFQPVQREVNTFRGQILPPGSSLEPLLDLHDYALADDTYARLRDNDIWTPSISSDTNNNATENISFHRTALADLAASMRTAPRKADAERPKQYVPRNPYNTPAAFPSSPAPAFDDPRVFEKLGTDTLFFIFYFCQGTYQQYLAAKQLKKQSWRYHNKYMTWFQRHEEPKVTTDEYEQGTYVYFDYESGWCQRIKSDFTFEYNFLEDELVA